MSIWGRSQDHSIRAADRDAIAVLGAKLKQPVFDATRFSGSARSQQPQHWRICLLYPPLRLVATNVPQPALTLHTEIGLAVQRLWANYNPSRRWRLRGVATRLDQLSQGEDQLPQAFTASG